MMNSIAKECVWVSCILMGAKCVRAAIIIQRLPKNGNRFFFFGWGATCSHWVIHSRWSRNTTDHLFCRNHALGQYAVARANDIHTKFYIIFLTSCTPSLFMPFFLIMPFGNHEQISVGCVLLIPLVFRVRKINEPNEAKEKEIEWMYKRKRKHWTE